MTTGAQRAETRPEHGIIDTAQDSWEDIQPESESAETADWIGEPVEAADEAPRPGRVFPIVLTLLALGWIGASIWSVAQSGAALTLAAILQWIAVASAPLILLCALWIAFGRTSRRETERFTHAVTRMRSESEALENVLEIVATRLEENQARLAGEAAKLMELGDEASDRRWRRRRMERGSISACCCRTCHAPRSRRGPSPNRCARRA